MASLTGQLVHTVPSLNVINVEYSMTLTNVPLCDQHGVLQII